VVRLPAEAMDFLLSKRFRPVHGPTQLPTETDAVAFRGVKQSKREADYLLSCGAYVKSW
jgi:hypothetical protein